MMHVEDNIR